MISPSNICWRYYKTQNQTLIIIMPAKAKSGSKSRSKSKHQKTPRANSRLNQTQPVAQIEKPIQINMSLTKLCGLLKAEPVLKPPIEEKAPSKKLLEREPLSKGKTSISKQSSRSKGSDIEPIRPKKRIVEIKPKKGSSRNKKQPQNVDKEDSSRKKKQLSRSSLSSASKNSFPNQKTSDKKTISHAKTSKVIPSEEGSQIRQPYKFDKAAFFFKQAQKRINSLLANYQFSKLVGMKLGFGKKILYTLEFENKEEGRKVAEEFYSSELAVLGKILNLDLEVMFLTEFLVDKSR